MSYSGLWSDNSNLLAVCLGFNPGYVSDINTANIVYETYKPLIIEARVRVRCQFFLFANRIFLFNGSKLFSVFVYHCVVCSGGAFVFWGSACLQPSAYWWRVWEPSNATEVVLYRSQQHSGFPPCLPFVCSYLARETSKFGSSDGLLEKNSWVELPGPPPPLPPAPLPPPCVFLLLFSLPSPSRSFLCFSLSLSLTNPPPLLFVCLLPSSLWLPPNVLSQPLWLVGLQRGGGAPRLVVTFLPVLCKRRVSDQFLQRERRSVCVSQH